MFACCWLIAVQVNGDHHVKPDGSCSPRIVGYPRVTIDAPGAAFAAMASSRAVCARRTEPLSKAAINREKAFSETEAPNRTARIEAAKPALLEPTPTITTLA
jgi:hypothetical protein